jgi:hypothetical protein
MFLTLRIRLNLLLLLLLMTTASCKQRHGSGSSEAMNSETSEACFPATDITLAQCGLSFPVDYEAPPEIYELFRAKRWPKQFEQMIKSGGWGYVQAAATKHSITLEEAGSIALYSSAYYEELNKQLRLMAIQEVYKPIIYLAASGLRKMPRYKGAVFRGTHLKPETLVKYEEALKNKTPIQELGFLSTSKDKNVMESFARNGRFIIESSTGTEIEDLSTIPTEKEVLFSPGSWFQVLDIKVVNSSEPQFIISMKEIVPK